MLTPPDDHGKDIWFFISAALLGIFSGATALISSERKIGLRAFASYTFSGGLVALCVVLLAVEQYGHSYFLVGIATLAGYKAFDILTALANLVAKFVQLLIPGKKL